MSDQIVYIDEFAIDTCNLLGQGACGKVFAATRNRDQRQYCAKIVPANSQNVQKELDILNYMKDKQNENIVNVFYCNYIPERNFFVIIMEKCESDLEKEIKQRLMQQRRYSEQEALEIMRQLFNGYKVLYQSSVIHRDIKPANILISQGKYKIADFGVGKIYSSDQNLLNITKNGTPVFKAPELQGNYEYSQSDINFIQGGGQMTRFGSMTNSSIGQQQQAPIQFQIDDQEIKQKLMHKVDIYSFGILFYNLLTGQYPFELNMAGIMEFINRIKQTPFRIMIPQLNLSPNTCQLIERMITYSPVNRIDFPTICQQIGLGFRLQTIYNRNNAIVYPVRPAGPLIPPSPIRVIPPQKPLQDLLQLYRTLFYEKCCENNAVIKIYRNYCDLCLGVAISQFDEKITLDLIADYVNKYLQANKCDIEFKFEVKLDKLFYINEYCRILKSQFIPMIFGYEQIKTYGEQHLKFMLISMKLIKGHYNLQSFLLNQNPNYNAVKEQIQRDFYLQKELYKQQLDELF
ncbi:unnamed protein product [Paramecium sonneborni]|uniref:Protein kinase domain-containing protein n=1 Tax=Paramecium sonneborni TaxID=65129 RepID=A0A8S1MFD2_9CILI|nr:unnamed protein product [Paramecium sonneborni]